ncbi:nuclear transport factor 2 family protein [Altererythrobacter sp. Root672]|uniref:nuclear transport factor 2 family protein n=1 Tax=Altererythrobacter sp. Root672 TaxID=1736584 RepID=UPI0006F7D1F7|nr:nuclear transport factor 2 family protein [Altererythrobacter sp. Root672]KRA79764.1 hypothetical protein ASD76_17255 [Altererythrobacter sp. Root672]
MRTIALIVSASALLASTNAQAEWQAANAAVAEAARDPRIAGALAQAARMDEALITDDQAAFRDGLSSDLVVNNPQNAISLPGDTARLQAKGRIRYDRYVRSIEYAGLLGDLVLLMGEERVVRRGAAPEEIEVRRFTDVWRQEDGKWRLAARQATKVPVS